MPTITVDEIAASTNAKYESMLIPLGDEILELKPVLRLSKHKRKQIAKLQADQREKSKAEEENGADEESDEDAGDFVKAFLRIAATNESLVERLFDRFGDDVAMLQELFHKYVEATQPGEASTSES